MLKIQNKLFIALLISSLIFAIELSKLSPFESLNSLFNQLKFKLHGQSKLDSALVLLYIDDNAIHSLGGYPLKRSYYALLIDLLTQLNVKAIALDILLTERNPDYPERDELLISTIKNSNRVYLGGSFGNLKKSDNDTSNPSKFIEKFLIKVNAENLNFIKGTNFLPPFDELLRNCAGLGHLNYIQHDFTQEIPLIIQFSENGYLPSLALELSRIYFNIPRDSVKIFKNEIYLGRIRIPAKNGKMLVNYTAGIKGLKMYSVLDFVKSYDAIKSGLEPEINLNEFKDKIAFIGIFSEALGQVVNTPFQDKFPPTGIHLMALNTIIQQKFLLETNPILNFILSFLFSFISPR